MTDSQMTTPVHDGMAARHLTPARHYLDSGYLSAETVVSNCQYLWIKIL